MATGSAVIIKFDFNSWKQVSENTGVMERYLTPVGIGEQ